MKHALKLSTWIRILCCCILSIYLLLFFQLSSLSLSDVYGPQKVLQRPPMIVSVPQPNIQLRPSVAEQHDPTPMPPVFDGHHGIIEGNSSIVFEDELLWDRSPVLPDWMKRYFVWHKEQRQLLNRNQLKVTSARIYLVECTEDYTHCGGTADRLAPLPFHVAVANATQRLLLIRWTKPKPLESFLLPPRGGIDWRIPDWMWHELNYDKAKVATYEDKIWKLSRSRKPGVVRVKFQSPNHGATTYNTQVRTHATEPSFEQVSHDLWRVFFTPTSLIAHMIRKYLNRLELQPGRYVTAHVRALYGVDSRDKEIMERWASNAVRCTTKFGAVHDSGYPILFVSDSNQTASYAQTYADQKNIPVRVRPYTADPLHLEKDENWTSRQESEYYDTFVDIYLIGMSQCVAYNMGGFGRWGSMLGYNSSCVSHMQADMAYCKYEEPLVNIPELDRTQPEDPFAEQDRLFPPPMTTVLHELPDSAHDNSVNIDSSVELYQNTSNNTHLWTQSKKMPKWMKRYFWWHSQQLKILSPENWKSKSYIVMQCLNTDEKCGGTSDRLKPLPTIVKLAAMSHRLLFIQWTRPCRLEEFLVPPKGGIDWRVPEWLAPYLEVNGIWAVPGEDVRFLAFEKNETLLRSRYQSNNGGSGWYDEQLTDGEHTFDEIYHDVWEVFFTPSPPLAKAIRDEMDHLGLVPNEYSSAHIRALYSVSVRPLRMVENWVKNGVNCASNLRPGKPVFVASDHKHASRVVANYSKSLHWPIVTHASNPDPPVHLDKADNQLSRSPRDFYDTFIDLYLLSLGGCVTYNKGGYGSWGLIIGGNSECKHAWKRTSKGIQNPCNFTTASYQPPSGSSTERQPLFLEPME